MHKAGHEAFRYVPVLAMDTLAVRTGEVAEGPTDTLSSATLWALIAVALSGAAAALGAGMSARE